MITKNNLEQLLIKSLFLGFVLIPFIRLTNGLLHIQTPLQYAPVVIMSFLYLLTKARGRHLLIAGINAAFLIFNLANTTEMSSIKMQIAGFTYLNSFLAIYLYLKDTKNSQDKVAELYFKPLFYSSLVFMILCATALIVNSINDPFDYSMRDILSHITFSRGAAPALRYHILVRLNLIGATFGDLSNIEYIGPQLIINAFIAFAYMLLFSEKIKSLLLKTIFTSLLFSLIVLMNSRAMALTTLLLIGCVYISPLLKRNLHVLSLIFIPFPFIQYAFSDKFISGRICQFNFVINKLSIFGHGVGANIAQLNLQCGAEKSLDRLQGIQSYSFDNIHLEFIHYFGILGYSALIAASIFFVFKLRNLYSSVLIVFTYFFFALNLNLFEIYFVPLLTIVFVLALKKEDYQENA